MTLAAHLATTALATALLMAWLWVRQLRTRNAGPVDVAWAFAVGGSGVLAALAGDAPAPRRLLIACVVTTWSLRLGLHLWQRVRSESEDGRYRELRERWGPRAPVRFAVLYAAQVVIATAVSIPAWIAASGTARAVGTWDALALGVAALAIAGESLADRQLARWRRSAPPGTTCREGLWRWSRHPNYFFEWVYWWSFVLLSLGAGLWWLSVVAGPALMLVFLLKLSGIPYTERQALRTRGDDYRDYQATTSAFFPWPPKRRPPPVIRNAGAR